MRQPIWTGLLACAALAQQTTPPPPPNNGGLPSVSSDGSHIAFTARRGGAHHIFVIAADGTGETQVTDSPETLSAPAWTADGKSVLYSVWDNTNSRIYSVDREGRNRKLLGTVPGRSPAISPDGKLALYQTGPFRSSRLTVSALDGGHPRELTDGKAPGFNAAWSPDGKRIAYTRLEANGEINVWVMNADGAGQRQVTHFPPEDGRAQVPAWSPDGRRLAIQSGTYTAAEKTAHIWIVDAATGEARKLAAHDRQYLDETPSWFPDGQRIAFQSDRTGRMEVWVMNGDGTGQRQLTK